MAEKKPTKYLIQTVTGEIYPWSDHLANRGDFYAYDDKTFGQPVNGRSPTLDSAKEAKKDK